MERDLGPLERIEQAVQERAEDISLEMAGPGKDKLRALIADEVARWSLDHRRGLRPFDLSDPEIVAALAAGVKRSPSVCLRLRVYGGQSRTRAGRA